MYFCDFDGGGSRCTSVTSRGGSRCSSVTSKGGSSKGGHTKFS